jgi:hypothetical protein
MLMILENMPARNDHHLTTQTKWLRPIDGALEERARDCAAAERQLQHEFAMAIMASAHLNESRVVRSFVDRNHEDQSPGGERTTDLSDFVQIDATGFDETRSIRDILATGDEVSNCCSPASDGYGAEWEQDPDHNEPLVELSFNHERSKQRAEKHIDVTANDNSKLGNSRHRVPRSNVNLRVEIFPFDVNQKTSRFGRNLIQPLKFWMGEGRLWEYGEIKGIIRAEPDRHE